MFDTRQHERAIGRSWRVKSHCPANPPIAHAMPLSANQRQTVRPRPRPRTTDTPLEMPSARRTLLLLSRLVRLRCPHCGGGRVLERFGRIRERCGVCRFRFERSDENYFGGAMFVNFMLGGGAFIVSFLAIIALSWPSVPWDALTYGAPAVLVVGMVPLYPVSKVVWLTVDVLVRPVKPKELE